MDYSRKISERLWNMSDKGELESRREETFIDDIIQKSHIEKELLSHLDEIKTVYEKGGVPWCITYTFVQYKLPLVSYGCINLQE